MKIKASEIRQLIREQYGASKNFDANEWVVLSEIRTNTGFESKWSTRGGPFGQKYIDMMAFNCWPSKGFLRIAFEIKTSRSDFLNELKRPEKRWLAMMYSHRFYYVAPKGVVEMRELPGGCGLIEVLEKGGKLKLHTAYSPMDLRAASPLPDSFIASLLRNVCKMTEDKEKRKNKVIALERTLDFPWWCDKGCYAKRFRSGEKIIQCKRSIVKYEFWTCPKCGNTVRLCIWRYMEKEQEEGGAGLSAGVNCREEN